VTDAAAPAGPASQGASPAFVFVGSNFHTFAPARSLERYEVSTARKTFPSNVTLGFRDNFWRVFSRLEAYDSEPRRLHWLGRDWELDSLWVAESRNVAFAQNLDDPVNIFLVFVLEPRSPVDRPIRDLIFDRGLDEQSAVAELTATLADTPHASFIASFRHTRTLNALFTWDTPQVRVLTSVLVAFFCFYSFALLMIWKVTREQTQIPLVPKPHEFRKQLQAVLKLRTHIINIEQHLLTHNVSNDPAVKIAAKSMRERFGLRFKLQNLLPLNEAIQRHLDVTAQLRDEQNRTIVSAVAAFFAFVGMPISLMSMLLAMNESVPIIKEGMFYIAKGTFLYFIGVTAAISVLSMCATVGLWVVAQRILRPRS
jgi:hypothetical protein